MSFYVVNDCSSSPDEAGAVADQLHLDAALVHSLLQPRGPLKPQPCGNAVPALAYRAVGFKGFRRI
jgi:hypothetical protein